MKLFKPLKIGLLTRAFEGEQNALLSISALLFVPFNASPLLHTEPDLWMALSKELGKELILDQGIPKPRAEVLLTAKFYPPSKQPVPAHKVRTKIGPLDKTLYIFGNRFWKRTRTGQWAFTDPEPISELEISYSNAFGGPKYAKNPLGKGIEPITLPTGETVVPLPNIELPNQLIVSKGDRPDPAGFGPLDITWPQRAKKAGTYDKKWLKERFPGYPDDMDWTIFNMAPEDQQIEGFFEGDEEFLFENMHPEKPNLSGRLPGLRIRCFVTQKQDGEEIFKEVTTRIDTLWFFPHIEKVLLIYRGLVEVADEEATDITHLLLGCEGPNDEPRPEEHYKKALEKRIDEETGHYHILNEADLLPKDEPSGIAEIMESAKSKDEDLLNRNMKNRMEREKQKAIRAMEEQGLDPKEFIKEEEPIPEITIENLPELPNIVQKLEQQAEQKRKEMEEKTKEMLKGLGLDPEDLKKKAQEGERRWPKFSAQEDIERLKESGIHDQEIEQKLREAEKQISSSFRQTAHFLPQSRQATKEEKATALELIRRAKEEGLSLADKDLAWIDLSGMDLRGIDLSRAYLEGAILEGTNLEGANLRETILVRAKIHNSKLNGADLSSANLGHAEIVESELLNCNLHGAVLAEAKVANSDFSNSVLNEADLFEARANKCKFQGVNLKDVLIMEAALEQCNFSSADLTHSIFLNSSIKESDFTGAVLTSATFIKTDGTGCKFRNARLDKACLTDGCSFQGVDFRGSNLSGTNLRGLNLEGTLFDMAEISGADFSQCKLCDVSFTLAVAKGTQFVKADLTRTRMMGINLMEGSLQRAVLVETDLSGANLYGVDFMKAQIINAKFQQANLKRAFLDRWIQTSK